MRDSNASSTYRLCDAWMVYCRSEGCCCSQAPCAYQEVQQQARQDAPAVVEEPKTTERRLDKDTEAGIELLVQLLRTHSDPKAALSAALGAVLALGQPGQVRKSAQQHHACLVPSGFTGVP